MELIPIIKYPISFIAVPREWVIILSISPLKKDGCYKWYIFYHRGLQDGLVDKHEQYLWESMLELGGSMCWSTLLTSVDPNPRLYQEPRGIKSPKV